MSLLQKIERQLYSVTISDAERQRLEVEYMKQLAVVEGNVCQ